MDLKIPTEEELRAVGNPAIDYYLDHIAPQLSEADKGRYIAIDVNSGEWEIGDDGDKVCEIFSARVPDAKIHMIRHINVVSEYLLTPFVDIENTALDLPSRQLADEAEEFGR